MYKRILVPVDGSETSMLGLLEAIKIAQSDGCQLVCSMWSMSSYSITRMALNCPA